MVFTLRPYQQNCVDRVMWDMKLSGNSLIQLPTGSGKSLVIAEVASRLDQEILILQPNREILEQNLSKLRQYVSPYDIGVYSASMDIKKIRKFTFATIGSIYKKPHLFDHIGLVIIDEAHLVNQKNTDSMYASFLNDIGNPKCIGLTATPYRNVTGYHTSKSGATYSCTTLKLMVRMKPFFWKRMLLSINPGGLVEQGYLCPLQYESADLIHHADLRTNKSMSDFDLEYFERMLKPHEQSIVTRIVECQNIYKSVLVFCSSVSQAARMAEVTPHSKVIHANTPKLQREWIIEEFKAGTLKTVYNMGVLTTGFDHPGLDCIVLNRPTKSLGLYYQMLGRGVRIKEGKTHCQVIDFTGTVSEMGPIESIKLVKMQMPQFQHPTWELMTESGHWHNRPLYAPRMVNKPLPEIDLHSL